MASEPLIHHHLIDKLAVLAGIFSGLALYPQVVSITLRASVEGVALSTYLILFFNSFVWLAYAVHRGLLSLGIASVLNIIASGIVLVWFMLLSGAPIL
jgi:uncharacterized protein with PQ loop repeat